MPAVVQVAVQRRISSRLRGSRLWTDFALLAPSRRQTAISRSFPDEPERERDGEIDGDGTPGVPAASGEGPQAATTAMDTGPAVVEERPVERDGEEVNADGDAVAGELAGWSGTGICVLRVEAETDGAGADEEQADEVTHGGDRVELAGGKWREAGLGRRGYLIGLHCRLPFRGDASTA